MLQIGDKVKLQCPSTLLWTVPGTVIETRPDKLSYIVQVGNKQHVRARRMLKICNEEASPSPHSNHLHPDASNANTVSVSAITMRSWFSKKEEQVENHAILQEVDSPGIQINWAIFSTGQSSSSPSSSGRAC